MARKDKQRWHARTYDPAKFPAINKEFGNIVDVFSHKGTIAHRLPGTMSNADISAFVKRKNNREVDFLGSF